MRRDEATRQYRPARVRECCEGDGLETLRLVAQVAQGCHVNVRVNGRPPDPLGQNRVTKRSGRCRPIRTCFGNFFERIRSVCSCSGPGITQLRDAEVDRCCETCASKSELALPRSSFLPQPTRPLTMHCFRLLVACTLLTSAALAAPLPQAADPAAAPSAAADGTTPTTPFDPSSFASGPDSYVPDLDYLNTTALG